MLRTEQKKSRKAKKRGGIDVQNLADTSLFLAVFIGLWQLVFFLKIFPEVSLPSPLMVGESFVELIQNMTLITSIGMTMYRLAIGFAVSIAIGLGVGLAMVKFPGFGKTMGSFAIGLQTFPSVAWVPFAILLIGLNDLGHTVCCSVEFNIFNNDVHLCGPSKHSTTLHTRRQKYGRKGLSLFRYVMIPASTPSIIVGVKQAWSFAWHALIGAEILMAASIGLGHVYWWDVSSR